MGYQPNKQMKYKSLINTFSLAALGAVGCSPGVNVQQIEKPGVGLEVINGTKAESHAQFPSIVALAQEPGNILVCSGTLIKPDLVVTAAHCVDWWGADKIKVVYGSTNVNELNLNLVHDMKATAYHEGYDPYGYKKLNDLALNEGVCSESMDVNDIGLVLLKNPIPDAVMSDIYDSQLLIDQITRLAGYGENGEHNSYPSDDTLDQSGDESAGVLYWGDVPIRVITEKEIIFSKNYPLGNNGEAGANPDACYGDSGGPTYALDKNGNLAGVITATSRVPPDVPWVSCGFGYVATRVAPYGPWIETKYEEMKALPDPVDAGAGGSGGNGGGIDIDAGVGGNGGSAGEGGSIPIIPKPDASVDDFVEKEDLVMLDRPTCNYSGSNSNSFPWALAAALLGVSYLRRRKE